MGAELPSGKKSRYYVVGDPAGLVNMGSGARRIPYDELRAMLKWEDDSRIKAEIGKRLKITRGEELEIICARLFEERKNGEWEKPEDWEKRYSK